MLNRIYATTVVVAIALPLVAFVALAPGIETPTLDTVIDAINDVVHDSKAPGAQEPAQAVLIPSFDGWTKVDQIPSAWREPFPRGLYQKLRYRSPETVRSVFEETYSVLASGSDEMPAAAQWRVILRSILSGLLVHSLDITLDKGLIDGVEAYLHLPSVDYFLENVPEGSAEYHNLAVHRSSYWPCRYPDRPWLLRWDGEDVFKRLTEVYDEELQSDVTDAMHRALVGWSPDIIRPWLPVAYFCKFPERLRPAVAEEFLRRTLEGKECPYLVNVAALFVYRADAERLKHLMEELLGAWLGATRPADQDEHEFNDPAFLYWLIHAIAPAFADEPVVDAIRSLEADQDRKPQGLETVEEAWLWARKTTEERIASGVERRGFFFGLMDGIPPGGRLGAYKSFDSFPKANGHTLIDLQEYRLDLLEER